MDNQARDEKWMKRALCLARNGEGLTRPNPPVGGVLLNGKGDCISEAWHRRAGGPHAEPQLLRDAGEAARGGTLFVTLEPCSTHGRTPPCVDVILEAGVRRVVVGCRDPNPAHAGRGIRKLARAGVAVTSGVCEAEAVALIEPFAAWVETGRPFVTLKLAMSLDGRIADATHKSQWITGPEARLEVQSLRRRVDAIVVGGGTVCADNPSLLPRPARGRQPWRVVLSSTCKLPTSAKVFTDAYRDRTLVVTTKRATASRKAALERTGAEVLVVPERQGRPSLKAALRNLGKRGILHVLCEGGGEVAGSLVEQDLVGEAWLFLAPLWLGSQGSVSGLEGAGWLLPQAPRMTVCETRMVGSDVLLRVRPR